MDNVRLLNEDPTIIEVENFSFEQPDSNKIKGWNGPGSDDAIANSTADIPGWASDANTHDSGIDARGNFNPQEGQYIAFLMGPILQCLIPQNTNSKLKTNLHLLLRHITIIRPQLCVWKYTM